MNGRTQRKFHMHAKAIKNLGVDGSLFSLAFASVETIWSIFIFSFFPNESSVGFLTAIFSVVTLLSLMFLFPLFKKFSPQKLLFSSIAASAIILAIFAHIQSPVLFVIFGILNAVFMGIRVQSFGVLIRHNSSKKNINSDENYIYLFYNVGWILGPLIAGFVADSISIRAVMILGSIFLMFSAYMITYSQKYFRKEHKEIPDHLNILKNSKDFFQDKKRLTSYILSGGLEVWWMIIYIFTPIIMVSKYGFKLSEVGIFLFLIIVPIMIVEFFMQKKEVKKLNKVIGYGYLLMLLLSLVAGFSGNIYIVLGALIVASIGVGFIEPTVESLFFSITKEKESEKFYGPFMTAKYMGMFIGKVVVAFALLFVSFQKSILIIGAFMLLFAIISFRSK